MALAEHRPRTGKGAWLCRTRSAHEHEAGSD